MNSIPSHDVFCSTCDDMPHVSRVAEVSVSHSYISFWEIFTLTWPPRIRINAVLWRLYCLARGRIGFPSILIIREGRNVVHYSYLLPDIKRLENIGVDGFEIGPCWTHPLYRRRGYFQYALDRLRSDFWQPGRKFWIVCRIENEISIQGIMNGGFVKIGGCLRQKGRWDLMAHYKRIDTPSV